MPAITIRLSEETHRALENRAMPNGRSTEAEILETLHAAVLPAERVGLGTDLAAIGREFGGIDVDIPRDKTVTEPITFDDLP